MVLFIIIIIIIICERKMGVVPFNLLRNLDVIRTMDS